MPLGVLVFLFCGFLAKYLPFEGLEISVTVWHLVHCDKSDIVPIYYLIFQAVNFGFACESLVGNFGEVGWVCLIEFWGYLLFHSNLAETSSLLHPYRMIPLSQESATEKGIGEHEQELQSIYAEEAREELTANYCKDVAH